jgi:hypothetical protein
MMAGRRAEERRDGQAFIEFQATAFKQRSEKAVNAFKQGR